MKIEVAQNKLAKALGLMSRVAAGARSTLPILQNVLIKSENSKVKLIATNLDLAVVEYLAVTKAEDGEVTVPARLLADFVGHLPNKEIVTIDSDGLKIKVKSGQYSSVLNGAASKDFPELPGINEKKAVKIVMSADDFRVKMAKTLVAVSNDTARPALTGILFDTHEGDLYAVATDAYRAVVEKLVGKMASEIRVLVPANSVAEVMRSLDEEISEVEILFDESQARFRLGEIEITSKVIDASYPDYWVILPKISDLKIIVEKEELMQAVRIASIFAKQTNRAIALEIIKDDKKKTGKIIVSSVLTEYGENASEVKVKKLEGEAVKIIVDGKFLADSLTTVDGKSAEISLNQNSRQILVRDEGAEDFWHVVMLMQD